jgi:hypothetical protein
MADLTPQEKRMFERVLEMGSGYVLSFCNRSFDEFVHDSTSRDIAASTTETSSSQ